LLRLHTRRTENEEVISSLMDAGNRIKSMRILYDKLLRSDNFSDISIFEYLSPLINEVMEVFPEKDEVQINKQIEDFEINAKLVFPLGIIINELFTNIMKYAFKDNVNNEVTIAASKRNGKALIVVQDNGIGISEEIDLKTTTSFGLKLVDMLIEQIDGSIEIVRENGTKFILEFDL
jgi:two-component sensor histidine kinase